MQNWRFTNDGAISTAPAPGGGGEDCSILDVCVPPLYLLDENVKNYLYDLIHSFPTRYIGQKSVAGSNIEIDFCSCTADLVDHSTRTVQKRLLTGPKTENFPKSGPQLRNQ